jgi:hypothetical protein
VIPTIPLDLLFSVLAGLFLAYSARAQLRMHAGSFLGCPALRVGLAWVVVVMWPIAAYFYFVHPDWSWMYWIDPQRVPKLVSLVFLLLQAAALVGGFAAGYAFIRAGRYRDHALAMGGVGVLLVLLFALLHRRIFSYGTFQDFRSGSGLVPISQAKLGYTLVVGALALAATLGYAGWQLHLAGRRMSS